MKGIIIGVIVAVAVAFGINYALHLQENPITGRMRFISLTRDQIMTVADYERDSVSTIVPTHMYVISGWMAHPIAMAFIFTVSTTEPLAVIPLLVLSCILILPAESSSTVGEDNSKL